MGIHIIRKLIICIFLCKRGQIIIRICLLLQITPHRILRIGSKIVRSVIMCIHVISKRIE